MQHGLRLFGFLGVALIAAQSEILSEICTSSGGAKRPKSGVEIEPMMLVHEKLISWLKAKCCLIGFG